MRNILFVIFVSSLLLSGCAKAPSGADLMEADYGRYPDNFEELIRDEINKHFFDPYSAVVKIESGPSQMYHAKPFGAKTDFGWGGIVSINAKNRYGAYTGIKRYRYLIYEFDVILFQEEFSGIRY